MQLPKQPLCRLNLNAQSLSLSLSLSLSFSRSSCITWGDTNACGTISWRIKRTRNCGSRSIARYLPQRPKRPHDCRRSFTSEYLWLYYLLQPRSITWCHSAVKKSRGNESVPSVPASRVKQQTAVIQSSPSFTRDLCNQSNSVEKRTQSSWRLCERNYQHVTNNVIFLYENELLIYSIMITSAVLILLIH